MLLSSLGVLLYWASLYVYVPILPVYARALGGSLTLVGLIVGSYGLAQLLLRVPLGLASDRLGRRQPFAVAGLVAALLSGLGLAVAPSAEWLLVGRTLAGVSAATWVTTSVLFAGLFPARETTRAMGLATFLTGLAQLLATTAGGKIADDLGWQAPFLVAAGLGLVGTLVMLAVPEIGASAKTVPDWRALLRAASQRQLLAVSLVAAIGQYAFWAASYAFVPVYADALGYTRTEIGFLTTATLLPYTVAALAIIPLARRLGDRAVVCLGLLFAALSPIATPLVTDFVPLALVQAVGGLGRGLAFPALMACGIRAVVPSERGTAMGVYQAIYALGMTVGPASAGLVAEGLGVDGALRVTGVMTLLGLALAWRALIEREPTA